MIELSNKSVDEIRRITNALVRWLEEIDSGKPNVPSDVQERVAALVAKKRCLFCNEPYGDEKITRGDHQKCYSKLDYRFRRKRLTERQAIEQGLLLEAYDISDEVVERVSGISANPHVNAARQGLKKQDELLGIRTAAPPPADPEQKKKPHKKQA